MRPLSALLALVLLAACPSCSSTADPAPPLAAAAVDQVPLHVLAVGDSIEVGPGSGDDGWRSRLIGLAASVGVELVIDPYAVGQWTAADALPGFAAALLRQPDVVLIGLGTNDGADPAFEARYNRLIKSALDVTRAQIFTSWVTYSACAGCAAAQAAANDAIFRQMLAYGYFATPRPARHPGWADMQDIPAAYLDGGGVHPRPANPDGYLVMAHKWWDVIAAARGLPPIAWTPPIPLTGHRP